MARDGLQRHRKEIIYIIIIIIIITSGQKSGLPNKCDVGAKIQRMLQDTVRMLATAELHVGCVPAELQVGLTSKCYTKIIKCALILSLQLFCVYHF